MNALVLFTTTGSGHVTAAEALYDEFKTINVKVMKIDTLRIVQESAAKNISKLYNNFVIKKPNLFGQLYKAGKYISNPYIKSIIYGFNMINCSKLYNIILQNNPDIILCTHIFSAQSLTHIKRKYDINALTACVATDYTCAPFWGGNRTRLYFYSS